MNYFDSHAHYWDARFERETQDGPLPLIKTLLDSSVCDIVNVGTTLDTTLAAIEQAKHFSRMYAAGGFHPSELPNDLSPEASLLELEKLFREPENKLVAVGEIGLDYHYEPFDKKKQLSYFHAQMELAERLSKPVLIHDREAHGDSMDVVRAHPHVTGVFHSYSGSTEMALELVRRGYYISFSGTVSFKNATHVRSVAASLPQDCVMIETDAPYLSPHPHRGKLNHSGYLCYTCAALAEAWGIKEEQAAQITRENALRFFNIKD